VVSLGDIVEGMISYSDTGDNIISSTIYSIKYNADVAVSFSVNGMN